MYITHVHVNTFYGKIYIYKNSKKNQRILIFSEHNFDIVEFIFLPNVFLMKFSYEDYFSFKINACICMYCEYFF